YYAENLTDIILPDSLQSIAEYAFYGCSSLTHITIPVNVVAVGRYALYSAKYITLNSSTALPIPEGDSPIGYSVKLIFVPSSLLDTYLSIFGEYSSKIVSVDVEYEIIDDAFIVSKTDNSLIRYFGVASYGITTPSVITSIQEGAFKNSVALSLILSEGITEIGEFAFYGASFSGISLPASLLEIGQDSFSSCSVNILIINGNTVFDGLFTQFSSISKITLRSTTVPELVGNIPESVSQINVPATLLDAYIASDGWSAYSDLLRSI
ncbi:MAG: leucine-rich repeat domain-containing protein, partial [Christensenellaceae bacterium]|nr:leucine-rich repeat domain-containing protein [Christensenellaceae bacterium]